MSYLERLLGSTRERVDRARRIVPPERLEQRVASIEPPRGFRSAIDVGEIAVVAEIKRASPLKGPLDLDLKAAELADAYRAGGAAALSVLTEPGDFRGSLDDLEAARGAGLPVLRKDFIIDDYQVLESRAVGADAVLLIVKCLGDELADLVKGVESLGMDALVEVHDDDELDRALAAGATLVGVNHRDLDSFDVDPERTAKLAPRVPPTVTLMALSGVSTRAEVEGLAAVGAAAVLVGESLVRSPDPAGAVRALLGRT